MVKLIMFTYEDVLYQEILLQLYGKQQLLLQEVTSYKVLSACVKIMEILSSP